MKTLIQAALLQAIFPAVLAHAGEFHVAISGDDSQSGSSSAPFRTIQRAAQAAQPGDVITVHQGIYRERVNPPRGGSSALQRIVYQAAPGEQVEIRGSEEIRNWTQVQENVWKTTLPNSFFGNFNPYTDLIRGDWFNGKGRDHHTGAVYLNGEWLTEAVKLEEVLRPPGQSPSWLAAGKDYLNPRLWFAQAEAEHTSIWAQFPGVNPNDQQVEINVRRTVFYPENPGCNYITVRGFTLRHAATPWAPPTAEQIGLLGTHWSKGWLIEHNTVSHSICSGIALGKHGDDYDNTSANTAEGYVKTIERAHAHPIPWDGDHIGHHIVRNNTVSHCEQAGIVGSLSPIFCIITGNVIHDIHVRRLFTGAEMAGIKLHAAIDTEISGNHIYRTTRGLWLDWMAQGTRVSRNLFHDNLTEDLFVEVNHGPFVVDNNVFLSPVTLRDWSEGGAYAHNLIGGKIVSQPELKRETPVHPAHKTKVAGLINIRGGDNRFHNNLFIGPGTEEAPPAAADKKPQRAGYGLWVYDTREFPLQTGGNVYLNGARPAKQETGAVRIPNPVPPFQLSLESGKARLSLHFPPDLAAIPTQPVSTESLGKARIPNLPYENPDGTPLRVNSDFFEQPRNPSRPFPGPFEAPGAGAVTLSLR